MGMERKQFHLGVHVDMFLKCPSWGTLAAYLDGGYLSDGGTNVKPVLVG